MNRDESDMNKSNVSQALQQEVDTHAPRARRIKQLIDQGADINYQATADGYTALMLAVDAGNQRIAEYLLTLGANPLLCNHNYEIASDLALRHSPLYLILKDYELLFATLNNDLEQVKLILDAGAIINFQAPDGYTALLIAVEQGLVEMTKLLLSIGADIFLTRADGKGVFELVTDEEVNLLLESGKIDDDFPSTLELTHSKQNLFFTLNSNKNPEKSAQKMMTSYEQAPELLPFCVSQLKIQPHHQTGIESTATITQIEELENNVGHVLPESYKEILKTYNGGIPELHYFDADEETFSLNHFYSLGDRKDSSLNIWWAINGFSKLAGSDTLPFAENATNDIYFFKWVDEIAQVWILRYDELEEPESDFVTHTFDELLSALLKAN